MATARTNTTEMHHNITTRPHTSGHDMTLSEESYHCRARYGFLAVARVISLVVIAIVSMSCGGPSSPDALTEAQVILTGDATWSGFFGPTNIPMSGTTTSAVITLNRGRQCAGVTKHGSGDRTRPSRLTIRVGDGRESTGNHEADETVTACGTGPLR